MMGCFQRWVDTLLENILFVDVPGDKSFCRDGQGWVHTLRVKILFVDLFEAKVFYRDGSLSGRGKHIFVAKIVFVDLSKATSFL